MINEIIHYQCQGISFTGRLYYSGEVTVKRPAVIVAHAWKGQDDFARQKAKDLAELGYVGFAADVYGSGILAKSDEEAFSLMLPLFKDREALQERIQAAVNSVKNHAIVEPSAIGAIGFCFGGLTVIELLRSGANVNGVVSFHGVLGNTLNGHKAVQAPQADKIKGAALILHGHNDPLVSREDIHNIQEELTRQKVDWQMNIYGNAAHAFTNPEAHDSKEGMAFDPKANMRSWMAMCDFFEEVFP